jgi:hypothetical protein
VTIEPGGGVHVTVPGRTEGLTEGVLAMGPDPVDVVAVQRRLLVQVEPMLLGNRGSPHITVPD